MDGKLLGRTLEVGRLETLGAIEGTTLGLWDVVGEAETDGVLLGTVLMVGPLDKTGTFEGLVLGF